MLLSCGNIPAQALIAELLYSSQNANVEVTNILPLADSQSILFGLREGFGRETLKFSFVEYNLETGEEVAIDLTSIVPDTLKDVQLKIINSQISIIGVKSNVGDSIWIAQLDEEYNKLGEFIISVSDVDGLDLIWWTNLNQFEDTYLLTGQFQTVGSNAVKTFAVEFKPAPVFERTRSVVLDKYMSVRDAVHIDNYWLIDDNSTYKLYDNAEEWVEEDVPALDFTRKEVNFALNPNGGVLVTGDLAKTQTYKRGSVVMHLDDQLNSISKDSLFFTTSIDSVTYNSVRAFTFSSVHNRLYTGGTSDITDTFNGLFSTDPSKIYIAGYDFDLNNEFVYTYQAPQFYANFDTKVVAPNIIASSGLTYSPVKELFQGYILLFAEDELVSSREQRLPERATLVSPNPSAGKFQFVWDGEAGRPALFKVYSGLGQLVRTGDISLGQTIDLVGAASGVYYLLVEAGERVLTQRLMVR